MHQTRTMGVCRRLDEVLGIGPITASAVYAVAGNGTDFLSRVETFAWGHAVNDLRKQAGYRRALIFSHISDQ